MSALDFLSETLDQASDDLKTSVEIEEAEIFPKVSDLVLDVPRWKKIENTVVVATDLKGSTKISYAKQDRVGARLYQASSGHCARILDHFEAEFIDIQGDGVFGIFHGDKARESAIASAFTLKSFSVQLAPMITEYLGPDAPEVGETGLKIGMADGTLLAKRIGVRGEHNEPVWAGKPVNYATKCAQEADRHELIITDRLFEHYKRNDYVVYSCGHAVNGQESAPGPLWEEAEVETLGDDSSCKKFAMATSWCEHCGDQFCAHILDGDTDRDNVGEVPLLREPPAAPASTEVEA